jgi:hypoxanthine phosphoribosyltransferase
MDNGSTRHAMNIIHRDEIIERSHAFSERVLCSLLHNVDATFVPILNGAINFYVSLSQMVNEGSHVELMPLPAQSYGAGFTSQGVHVSRDLIIPEKIRDRTVVLVDDVLDTGRTVIEARRVLELYKPKRIVTVFLVRKMHRTKPPLNPDYWLFEVHSESWVYGFGMDLAEKYRHLRFICDAKEELYDSQGRPKY